MVKTVKAVAQAGGGVRVAPVAGEGARALESAGASHSEAVVAARQQPPAAPQAWHDPQRGRLSPCLSTKHARVMAVLVFHRQQPRSAKTQRMLEASCLHCHLLGAMF